MYEFLSEEWIDAARDIRHKHADKIPPIGQAVRINLVVTDVPVGDGTVWAYVDTTEGTFELELGELEQPDAVMMTDHATARSLLVDRNPEAAMESMMTGKIRVQGDMMKLIALQMALQAIAPDAELANEIAAEFEAITLRS